MKYLKKFKELINEGKNIEGSANLRDILMDIFRTFKTKEDMEEIFDKEDQLVIATDLYDAFIDAKDLLELDETDLLSFADNLGVGGEPDILIAIIQKMYEEKFKRKMKDDVVFCIDVMKEFVMIEKSSEKYKILSKRYSSELEKIKNLL